MLKECTSENGYKFSEEDKKTRENALKRNFKTAIKTLKLLRKKVAPEVSLGKIDKNITSLCFNFKSDLHILRITLGLRNCT